MSGEVPSRHGGGQTVYSASFFDLQVRFARRVAQLAGLPIAEALLEYTNLYVRFGLGRDFNAAQPIWRRYLTGIDALDIDDGTAGLETWTHLFYRSRCPERAPPMVVSSVGCFSYSRWDSNRIRLHFHNADGVSVSPLAMDRRSRRREDLHALFSLAQKQEPATPRVVGTSWLYNLAGYRRLFPDAYLASALPTAPMYRNMPLWGQFVDRHGGVRPEIAAPFFRRLDALQDIGELARCFPLRALRLESSAAVFYEHFG